MRDKLTIRRPTSDDQAAVYDLFKHTITDNFSLEGLGDDLEGIRDELADKEKKLDLDLNTKGQNMYFLLACIESKIVGTISYGPSSSIIDQLSQGKLKSVGEIGTVFVLPAYQSKGIGSLLFKAMLVSLLARHVDDFVLDSGYKIAKQIWTHKLGSPTIKAKDYWGKGVDHLVWYRKIHGLNITFKPGDLQ